MPKPYPPEYGEHLRAMVEAPYTQADADAARRAIAAAKTNMPGDSPANAPTTNSPMPSAKRLDVRLSANESSIVAKIVEALRNEANLFQRAGRFVRIIRESESDRPRFGRPLGGTEERHQREA
jgi:hypothetical protein